MKYPWLVVWTLSSGLGTGCSEHRSSDLDDVVQSSDCELAAQDVAVATNSEAKVIDQVQTISGTAASYGLATAGYTADVVVTASAGIIAVVAYCPVTFLLLAAGSIGPPVCFTNSKLGRPRH